MLRRGRSTSPPEIDGRSNLNRNLTQFDPTYLRSQINIVLDGFVQDWDSLEIPLHLILPNVATPIRSKLVIFYLYFVERLPGWIKSSKRVSERKFALFLAAQIDI